MRSKLVLPILCLLAACSAQIFAQDVQWTPQNGSTSWSDPANWNPAPPSVATSDKAKVNYLPGPIINAGETATSYEIFEGESGSSNATFTINSGGTVSTTTQFVMGYYSGDHATLTINGGTLNCGTPGGNDGHLFVGYSGTGNVVLNGGSINIINMFGISWEGGGGVGRVDINGGTITATSFTMVSAGGVGTLNVAGGQLILAGDQTQGIANYLSKGWIIAYNRAGTVKYDYNITNAGKTTVYGLNRSSYAHLPAPADTSTNVEPYVSLSWTAGDGAVTQNVYFGTDANSVTNATTSTAGIYKGPQPATNTTYAPSSITMGQTYYWRVDEITDSNTFKGDTWSFSVGTAVTIDDFESYITDANIQSVWTSGLTNGSGSTLTLSTAGGHNVTRAAQLAYDNSGSAGKALYSEITRNAMYPDWTIQQSRSFDIWYRGLSTNSTQPLYCTISDNSGHVATVVNPDPNAGISVNWQVWHLALSSFIGINFANVRDITIGLGSKSNPAVGGTGTIYLDDIALFPSRCLNPPANDLNGDCIVDLRDYSIFAQYWLQQIPLN